MELEWILGLGLIATAIVAALLGIVILATMQGRNTAAGNSIFSGDKVGTVFLFDGDALIDALSATPLPRS